MIEVDIIAVRHGDYNSERLSPLGLQQAKSVAQELSLEHPDFFGEDKHIKLYTSPIQRAAQTAQIVIADLTAMQLLPSSASEQLVRASILAESFIEEYISCTPGMPQKGFLQLLRKLEIPTTEVAVSMLWFTHLPALRSLSAIISKKNELNLVIENGKSVRLKTAMS